MLKAHKIRLHPTPEQSVYFAKAAGTARFVWNWALAEWKRQYEAGEKPTALKLKKQFNKIRREQKPYCGPIYFWIVSPLAVGKARDNPNMQKLLNSPNMI